MRINRLSRHTAVIVLLALVLSFFSFGGTFSAEELQPPDTNITNDNLTNFSDNENFDDVLSNENFLPVEFFEISEDEYADSCVFKNRSETTTALDTELDDEAENPTIKFSKVNVSVRENETFALTVTTTPENQPVSFSVEDSAVATVSNDGIVTGRNAGTTKVTASMTYNGTVYTTSCNIFTIIPDGCYYIKNGNSNLYMTTSGMFDGDLGFSQSSKVSEDEPLYKKLRQYFKVRYLEKGCYSIRPFNSIMMPVCAEIGPVEQYYSYYAIENILRLRKTARWMISRTSDGFVFYNTKTPTGAIQVENASVQEDAAVIYNTFAASSNCKWTMEAINNPPSGMIVYNMKTGAPAENVTRRVFVDDRRTFEDMHMYLNVFMPDSIDQTVTWTSSDGSVVLPQNSMSSTAVGMAPGSATMTVSRQFGAETCSFSYNVIVSDRVTVNVQALYDGGYVSRFPDYATRIENSMQALKTKYKETFGIVINYTTERIESYADTCSTSYNAVCNHVTDDECQNSKSFTDGSFQLADYHHCNLMNSLFRIPVPDADSGINVKIAFLGHDYCYNTINQSNEKVHNHNYGKGVTFSTLGLIAITNFGDNNAERNTLIHEFGHIFGAPDHSLKNGKTIEDMNAKYGVDLFNNKCLYGDIRSDVSSDVDDITICPGCQYVINLNRYRFTEQSE